MTNIAGVCYSKSVIKDTKGVTGMDDKKLEQAMKEKNVSVAEMCKALGLSRSAFYRKRKGISEFTHSEIQKIVNILDLGSPVGIFFAQ